jgi:peptidoglycan/xylan/chitin deacetylase (PgdA/CDA1 family)
LWITVPVEFFPLDAPAEPFRPLGALDRGYPDFWSYSNRDYGARIGIYRIMRVLDSFALRATAAVNAAAATRYPRIVTEILKRGWEIAANGIDMGHVHHGGLSVEDERTLIRDARESLASASRQVVAGWYSPGHSQSSHTFDLVAEHGFEYVMDWANDDLPYALNTAAGQLWALPLTYEWSDRLMLVQHTQVIEEYETQVLAAFRQLRAEAEKQRSGRILSLSISPWVIGYPHRIAALERMLREMIDDGSVWSATGTDILGVLKS